MCLSETCSENPVCYKRLHTHILRLIMFCRHNLLLKALLRRYEKDQVMQGNCIRFSHLSSPCSWISWFICIFPNFIRLTCTQTCPGLHVRVRAQNILNQLRKQNARTNDPITRMDDTRLQAQLELYLHDWNGLQFRLFMVPSGADIGSVCGLWRLWPQLCSLPASIEPASSQMETHKFRYPRVPRVRLPCDALPPQDWQGMTRTKHDRTQTKHSKYSDHHDLFDYLLLHMCCLVQASSIPTSMSFECFGRQRPENKSLKQWQAVTSSLDISWYTGQHVVPTREVSKFCLSSLRPLTWLPFLPKFLL